MKTIEVHTYPDGSRCVACPMQARDVPLEECGRCSRGFVVTVSDNRMATAICPPKEQAHVGDIMSRKVLAVHSDLLIERLILLLIDENLSAVTVVDDEKRPIGVVSKTDLVFDDYEWAELRDEAISLRRVGPANDEEQTDLYVRELLQSRTVRDIMSGEPITISAHAAVTDVAKLMHENGVHECPVVDVEGQLVGMVTSMDVVRWVAR
jgi:CBS domain-containing protein